tara:strand:- start:204 stop:1571 length:1368 start_codon:yes stop_codon:yes gene_type:complete
MQSFDNFFPKASLPVEKDVHENDKLTGILVVDSRNRDKSKFPNPNKYIYYLNEEFKRVYEIELLHTMVPKSQYLINKYNNTLYINLENNDYTLYIPQGNYSQNDDSDITIPPVNTSIASFISKNLDYLINNVFTNSIGNNLTCLYDHNTNKYFFYYAPNSGTPLSRSFISNFTIDFQGVKDVISTIDHGKQYIIEETQLYKNNSIGPILGFNPNKYSNTDETCVNFTFNKINLSATMTFNVNNEALFDKLLYTITNNNPVLSRLMISQNRDFSSSIDIISFNVNTQFGTNPFNYQNIYNYTNTLGNMNNDIWKLKSIDRITKKIIIETDNYSMGNRGLANSNANTIFLRFSYIVSDNVANLEGEPYALLQIDEMNRLDSKSSVIQNSYEIITFTNNQQVYDHSKSYGNVKIFNPVLNKLDRLNINFKNFDDTYYDFNGAEHCLIFAITYNKHNSL